MLRQPKPFMESLSVMSNSINSHPYLRAAQKFPVVRQQATERLSKRPGHGRPIIPEVVEDRPGKPATPGRQPEPVVVRRVKDSKGRFRADDPATPKDEAWKELS
jgi:hypothetical protein